MLSVFEKTTDELSQELNQKSASETQKQTLALLEILKLIGEDVQKNKSVQVENIVRQVVGEVSIKRPDWIKDLIPNNTPFLKKLDYIASAIIRKEVVKKMDFNRPQWLDEIKPKDIVFPESKEAEKINPVLKEILSAIKEQEKVEEVSIKGEVEIKEPKWWKIDLEKPMLSMAKFLKGLQEKLFKVEVQNEITIKNPVSEITVKNPQKEVKISNLKVLEENTALMTAQLRALGTTGSNAKGGSEIDTSNLATEETLQAVAEFNIPKFDTQIIDETDAPGTTVITYKLAGDTVATKTITVVGAVTTISIL